MRPKTTSVRTCLAAALLAACALQAVAQSTYIRRSYAQKDLTKNDYYGTESIREETHPATFLLRTNTLYDLALSPNVGLEFQTSLGLAFQFDYVGAWWNQPSDNRFFSSYGFQASARWYFDNADDSRPFRGWHAGIYGQMATFDFEFGGEGYQCPNLDRSFGLGLSGGYTLPISRRWAVDFTLGLGYFQSKYFLYSPSAYGGNWLKTGTKLLKFWGPTRAEVSLVWSLNKDNKR